MRDDACRGMEPVHTTQSLGCPRRHGNIIEPMAILQSWPKTPPHHEATSLSERRWGMGRVDRIPITGNPSRHPCGGRDLLKLTIKLPGEISTNGIFLCLTS